MVFEQAYGIMVICGRHKTEEEKTIMCDCGIETTNSFKSQINDDVWRLE